MIDQRLLGTWKSDTRKTMADIRNRRDIPEEDHEKLKKLFGKLRIQYTRTRAYTEYEGDESVVPYQFVAKDANSVAITSPSVYGDGDKIQHIHFEGKYYWICLGQFREYFKRVD